jgi:Flp pilus assembly protein TadD
VRLRPAITKMRPGELDGALADIRRCLVLKPGLTEAHVVHGRILTMNGDLVGADAAFRRALAADPNSFDALLKLGAPARQQGRPAEARDVLNGAPAIRSGDIRIRFQLALVESAEGRDVRVVELPESVVKDAPNFLEAHIQLTALYFRIRRPDEGRRERRIVDGFEAERLKRHLER